MLITAPDNPLDKERTAEEQGDVQFPSRLSESQKRRLAAQSERANTLTKRQRNRDPDELPWGSLATD